MHKFSIEFSNSHLRHLSNTTFSRLLTIQKNFRCSSLATIVKNTCNKF